MGNDHLRRTALFFFKTINYMKSIPIILLCLPFIAASQTLYLDTSATLHVERGSSGGTVLYVDGNLENLGTISDQGSIEVNGDASLPGTLEFMICGTASGTGFDPVFAGGDLTLTGGTLDVTLKNGFTPAVGDEFTVLDAGGLDGIFTTVNLPALGGSKFWTTNYDPGGGTLKLGVSSLLPVELLDFQAVAESEHVSLHWRTASEFNADRFEVEHSVDGVSFGKIGTMKAKGSISTETTYAMLHLRPAAGVNYYRLRQMDLDGGFDFSKVVSVDMGTGWQPVVQVFPNPASHYLNVVLPAEMEGGEIAQFFDATGQLVFTAPIAEGTNPLDVSSLAAGHYLLQITTGASNFVEKVTVE